jgi:hypothetical protein
MCDIYFWCAIYITHFNSIAEILEMACHAVLYRFVMETQGWEKEDMEVRGCESVTLFSLS